MPRPTARARAAGALVLALCACEPSTPPARWAMETSPAPAAPASTLDFSWPQPVEVEPDLDEVQAAVQAARTVLGTMPEDDRKRVLQRLLPYGPPAPAPDVASPAGAAPAAAPTPSREALDLLSVMRDLHARHKTKELALAAFFLGPGAVARARRLLRLAPERIDTGALSLALRRRELRLLRYVREARRWATLYGLLWPVERTWRVTSGFGRRVHPILGSESNHLGIDLSMPVGTEVRAPSDGVVLRVRQGPVNGRWIEIDHGNGVRTLYCHLSAVDVRRGQKVKAGEVVARSGDTGRVTGPHLHYQVRLSGSFVDPLCGRAPATAVAEPLSLEPTPAATPPQAAR